MPLLYSRTISANRNKPLVLLFCGKPGIGKTETAKYLAELIGGKLFRQQFSMFQNNQFSNYLFGGNHHEKSFAKDLLGRESDVILLDEPTNALDENGITMLRDVIKDQKRRSATVLVASHDRQFLEELSDSIYLFDKGKVRQIA